MLAVETSWMNKTPLKAGDYGKLAENWFKRNERFENFYILTERFQKHTKCMPKHCIGDEDFCIIKMLNFTDVEDATYMQCLIVKLDMYCSNQGHDLLERQRYQDPNESFDSIVAARH